ncbi:hypothetical protein ACFR97_17610 [Haloplanus litoreus]|uniref:Uncharacterized protein n=1 Tax=Haloplanus litoreus TaxID=767515 RepID=A0ABD6A447_9EURY
MPRTERSDGAAAGNRRRLPEGTEHVVVIDETGGRAQATAPAYRVPATRLAQYDDVDLSEYVDEDEDPESVTVYFEPGDELPLPVAAAGAYRAHPDRFACFDAGGNRLDSSSPETNEGIRQWQAARGER